MAFHLWGDDKSAILDRMNPRAGSLWKAMNALRAIFLVAGLASLALFFATYDLQNPLLFAAFYLAFVSLSLYVLCGAALAYSLGYAIWAALILVLSIPGMGAPAFVFRLFRADDILEDGKSLENK